MQVNDIVYHPCSVDIIPFKIKGIRSYEDHSLYEAQATGDVGACGAVEVLLTVDRKGAIRFMGLMDDYEYDSGLQDFVEGEYFLDETRARLAFYQVQRSLCLASLENKKRIYDAALDMFNRVENILDVIKKDLTE